MYESPIFPHLHQHLLLSMFFILAILVDMESYLISVWICTSLIANDEEHTDLFIRHLYNFFGEISIKMLHLLKNPFKTSPTTMSHSFY